MLAPPQNICTSVRDAKLWTREPVRPGTNTARQLCEARVVTPRPQHKEVSILKSNWVRRSVFGVRGQSSPSQEPSNVCTTNTSLRSRISASQTGTTQGTTRQVEQGQARLQRSDEPSRPYIRKVIPPPPQPKSKGSRQTEQKQGQTKLEVSQRQRRQPSDFQGQAIAGLEQK